MNDEYDWDIYTEFKNQIEDQLPNIQFDIINLYNKENILFSVNNLFREFHNYKSLAGYLSLTPLQELSHKTETILGCIRENENVLNDAIVEWVFEVKEQLERWLEEMNNYETDLQPIPVNINKKIKITRSYTSSTDKLKTLSLVYIDNNNNRAQKITPFLQTILKEVIFVNSEYSKNILNNYDIIMINLNEDNYKHIEFIQNLYPDKPIIPVFDEVNSNTIKKSLKFNITNLISCKLSKEKLKRELRLIVKTFFNSKNILIDNIKIKTFIKTLEPLSNTIIKIIRVCDDEETSINQLISVVKSDPVVTANILKYASSPLYGSKDITTIDNAVIRLGKKIVKAISLNGIQKNLNASDLSSYDIDEKIFSEVSIIRLSLMLKWYSKVNVSDLNVLSSTALLGNIGQLLISKELININKDDEFKKLYKEFTIKFAEESILQTTTSIVSSQILNYWKLPNFIVDSISHSDNPSEATQSIKHLAVANHIVYKLVDLRGNVLKKIPNDILSLMKHNNLDPNILDESLKYVLKNI